MSDDYTQNMQQYLASQPTKMLTQQQVEEIANRGCDLFIVGNIPMATYSLNVANNTGDYAERDRLLARLNTPEYDLVSYNILEDSYSPTAIFNLFLLPDEFLSGTSKTTVYGCPGAIVQEVYGIRRVKSLVEGKEVEEIKGQFLNLRNMMLTPCYYHPVSHRWFVTDKDQKKSASSNRS